MPSETELEFLTESNLIENEGLGALPDSIDAWDYARKVRALSEKHLLELHRILMRSRATIPESEKGRYTPYQTGMWSGGRLVRLNPKPSEVRKLALKWIRDINASVRGCVGLTDAEKEEIAKKLHVQYELSHVLSDGNGRTGRIWMNWHRLRLGLPIIVIRASEREEYYKWFRE